MRESFRTFLARHGFNLWPCYRGSGGRVTFIAGDWSEVRVRLPLSWRTRNYVGTIYGGSMYAAIDPFFMIMLIHRLGPGYEVWDKGATIRFRKPGRTALTARLRLPDGEEEAIRQALQGARSVDRTYRVELVDQGGQVHAEVDKVVYVRLRYNEWANAGVTPMKIRYDLKPATRRRTTAFKPEGPLSFGQLRTDHMFLMDWADGSWRDPRIVPYGPFQLAPGAVVLHYSQEIFEGAKAFKHADGEIHAFRIDKNAERMNRSAPGLCMPTIPVEDQVQAILALLDVDRLWFPEQDGASLYIRPFMIGTQDSLGVKPSSSYTFCVFVSPSGPYYPKGFTEPIKLLISKRFHRAAPGGTGALKTGGNYAASLRAGEAAHHLGCSQVLFLDTTDRYIEEAGAMNHYHVTRDGRLVIPTFTDSILRSVTSESVLALGNAALGVETVQERIPLDGFLAGLRGGDITEAGGFGTAAVVSPVGAYVFEDKTEVAVGGGGIGPVTRRVYDVITGIQRGTRPAPEGWLFKAERLAPAPRAASPARKAARAVPAKKAVKARTAARVARARRTAGGPRGRRK